MDGKDTKLSAEEVVARAVMADELAHIAVCQEILRKNLRSVTEIREPRFRSRKFWFSDQHVGPRQLPEFDENLIAA